MVSADSSHALYFTNYNLTNSTGTLTSRPVVGGAATVQGSNSFVSLSPRAAQIVYIDNTMLAGNPLAPVRGDLKAIQTTGGGATLIAPQSDLFYVFSSARDHVIYTLSNNAGVAGLYTVALP